MIKKIINIFDKLTQIITKKNMCNQLYIRDNNSEYLNSKYCRFNSNTDDNVTSRNHNLSLVLIIKNDSSYIKEWIEFHRIVGVDHFYIYDNESTDNLYDVLYSYIQEDIVTYTFWPGQYVQVSAYNDAIKKHKYDTQYLGFIDSDEFIVPVEEDSLLKVIDSIFKTYANCGGIGVNWRVYGSSFHDKKVEGLVVENYKYRNENVDKHIKTICNPRAVKEFTNPHFAIYLQPYKCISEDGKYISGPFNDDCYCSKLRINHYYFKSLEDFLDKNRKGKADTRTTYKGDDYTKDFFKKHDNLYNIIYDDILDKYVNELKKRCSKM